MRSTASIALAFAAFAALATPVAAPAVAQVVKDEEASFFDPMDRLSDVRWNRSEGWRNGEHQSCTWTRGEASVYKGALELTMRKRPRNGTAYTCAEVQSKRRFHYGTYEARVKVPKGSGLNANFFTYIGPPLGVPDHDEIDFEFLGKDTTKVQINFWKAGAGKNEVLVDLGFDAAEDFHTYAFTWAKDRITWYIDGRKVHETADGAALPQNPGILFLSLWSGSEQVDDWLGPFTYPQERPIMAFDWVAFTEEGKSCLFPESVTCAK